MRRNAGFTLVELMIVVAVIAILASIVVPSYRDHVLRSKISEATSTLTQTRMRMEQWYADNRSYAGADAICNAAAGNFTYDCVQAPGANTYTLRAQGLANQGTTGFTYTLNHADVKTSVTPWAGNRDCWVVKKATSC